MRKTQTLEILSHQLILKLSKDVGHRFKIPKLFNLPKLLLSATSCTPDFALHFLRHMQMIMTCKIARN